MTVEKLKEILNLCDSDLFNWQISDGQIRANGFCPLTAACYQKTKTHYDTDDYIAAAEELGVSADLAEDIIEAADRYTDEILTESVIQMRQMMLDHFNLKSDFS